MKHTKGPWKACFTRVSGAAVGFHIVDREHGSIRPICEQYDKHREMPAEEIEANAGLITAAPELLEALISAERVLSEIALQCGPLRTINNWHGAAIEKSRAAISKATGGNNG